jgi:hypothetical protein
MARRDIIPSLGYSISMRLWKILGISKNSDKSYVITSYHLYCISRHLAAIDCLDLTQYRYLDRSRDQRSSVWKLTFQRSYRGASTGPRCYLVLQRLRRESIQGGIVRHFTLFMFLVARGKADALGRTTLRNINGPIFMVCLRSSLLITLR